MDEDFLTREFEAVLRDEPPLGFDPDQLVDSAARRQRRRRMTLLAGGGVVAVAVAAICVPLAVTGDNSAPEHIAAVTAPATSTGWTWSASVPALPSLSVGQLAQLANTGQQHFGYAVAKAFPDVSTVKNIRSNPTTFVTTLDGSTTTGTSRQGYSIAGTAVSGQRLVDLQLDVKLASDVSEPTTLRQQCAADRHTTCTYDQPSGGEAVVTSHEVFPLSTADAANKLRPAEMLLVKDLRPDGTEVDVTSNVPIAADPTQVLATPDQLTALARDTVFGPTG